MASQLYCKIVDGSIVARERKDSPEVATGPDGNPVWRPYVAGTRPSHDAETQHAPVKSEVIEDTQVTETWADPVDKTAQELDAEKVAAAQQVRNKVEGKLHKMSLAGLFWIVNDVRNRAGQQPIDADTFLSQLDTYASQFSDQKFLDKIKALDP